MGETLLIWIPQLSPDVLISEVTFVIVLASKERQKRRKTNDWISGCFPYKRNGERDSSPNGFKN